jgi:lipoprotein-anchoring transpeptidase ErfK/SrfK
MSVLKVLVPLCLVVFVVISFAFLEGWPFRGASVPARPDATAAPVSLASGSVVDASSAVAGGARVETSTPAGATPDLEAEVRARLARTKSDPESYRAALSDAVLDRRLPRAFRESLLPDLRTLNEKLVFTTEPRARFTRTTVRKGDNLTKIAQAAQKRGRTNATPAFLMRVNHMKSTVVRAGQVLNIPEEKIALVAHENDFRLFVLLGDAVAIDYDIGTGLRGSTPAGTFTIRGKTRNPDWTTPEGRVVPYGHPDHIIGSRWMGFDGPEGRTTYGIHGTIDETSIGKAESAGCIRMRRVDVEELFELVPEGCGIVVK